MIISFCCCLGALFYLYKYLDKFCLEIRKSKEKIFSVVNTVLKLLMVFIIYDDIGHNILIDIFSYIDINNTYLIIIPFIGIFISIFILCRISRKQYRIIFKSHDIDIFLVLALDIAYILILFSGITLNSGILQSLLIKEIL